MDYKKEVKNFINYICEWVNERHNKFGDMGFSYTVPDYDRFAFIVSDKAIDKRIKNQLNKKYDINADVTYEKDWLSYNQYVGGEIIIRIKKAENIYCLGINAF